MFSCTQCKLFCHRLQFWLICNLQKPQTIIDISMPISSGVTREGGVGAVALPELKEEGTVPLRISLFK